MKKAILSLLFLCFLALPSFAQSKCQIENHYPGFIKITREGDGKYLHKRVVETDNDNCFAEFINQNIIFTDYLLTNFSSNTKNKELLKIEDSTALSETYFSYLKQDSLFNATMQELASKAINKEQAKDSISIDELLNIAVKYFSILRLSKKGHYIGKVCVGQNDIKKTEAIRKPFIEAFCFASIFQHYQSEEFNMHNEFVKSIQELYKVNLGIDEDEKLLRAQGALFLLMRNSQPLKEMLKFEYEKGKELLPFVLVD